LTTLVFGLRFLLQAATLLLVARLLGPENYGVFAGAAALAIFLGALSAFGMPLIFMRIVARLPSQRDEVLAYAFPTILLLGSVTLCFYLMVSFSVFGFGGFGIGILLPIGLAEIVLQPLLVLCAADRHGLGRVASAQLLQVAPLALRLLSALLVMAAMPRAPVVAYAIGYLAASVLALWGGTRGMPFPYPCRWRLPRRYELREALGFAVADLSRNGPTELDKTLAARLLPAPAAGLYAAGTRIMAAVVLPVMALAVSALPRLFREGDDGNAASNRLVLWMSCIAFLYGIVLSGVLWYLAPWMDFFLGNAYQGVGEVVRTLCWVVPGLSLRLVFGNVLVARGQPWMRVGFESAGLLVLAVMAIWLANRNGAIGMPMALVCSEWAMAMMGGGLVIRLCRRHR